MQLAYALTATDMRMRENDVIFRIPKSSYILQLICKYFTRAIDIEETYTLAQMLCTKIVSLCWNVSHYCQMSLSHPHSLQDKLFRNNKTFRIFLSHPCDQLVPYAKSPQKLFETSFTAIFQRQGIPRLLRSIITTTMIDIDQINTLHTTF